MAEIVRGTTPTIQYTFSRINPANITTAYLTVTQDGVTIVERGIDTMSLGNEDIAWTFTQEETLSMKATEIRVMLNWLLQDGTRGASKKAKILVQDNDKAEVI